jgi:hypothetical protein
VLKISSQKNIFHQQQMKNMEAKINEKPTNQNEEKERT